jgi:hypothetical protein
MLRLRVNGCADGKWNSHLLASSVLKFCGALFATEKDGCVGVSARLCVKS